MENRSVSAAIVTYNDGDKALKAVKSVLDYTKKYPLSLYVFDNGSTDDTVSLIKNNTSATVIENGRNLGFGAAHNLIFNYGLGKYHFVINPDIEIKSDVLSEMVDFFEEHSDVVMAMPKILYPNGVEQKLPKEEPTFKRLFFGRISKRIRNEYIWADKKIDEFVDIDFCSGCFFGIKSEIFKKLGGFDKRYFMYLEDADLTRSVKKIGRVVFIPTVSVIHKWERASAKSIKYLFIHIISCIKFLTKKRS